MKKEINYVDSRTPEEKANEPTYTVTYATATTTEPVTEDWEVRLKEFDKKHPKLPENMTMSDWIPFIRQTRLSLLKDLEREIESKIRDVGENTKCNFCGEHIASGDCDCTGVNKGLQVGVDIINKYKK